MISVHGACLLAASMLVASACSNRNAGQFRVVHQHSGNPAGRLEIALINPVDGSTVKQLQTTDDGYLPEEPGANWMVVRDPIRNVVLMNRAAVVPGGHELRVPEAIRVRGTIATMGDPSKVKLRVGFGDRVAPSERRKAATRDTFVRTGDENRPFGIELPQSALGWSDAKTVTGTGVVTFESDWIPASAPQIVAFDPEGRMVVADVQIPAKVMPGATVDAGTLTLGPASVLDIQMDVPETDLPMGFLLSVETVEPDAATVRDAAKILSVLDQASPQLFDLLTRRARYPLAAGMNHLGPMPSLGNLTVAVLDPSAGVRAERSFEIQPGAENRISFAAQELSPKYVASATTVAGHLVLSGSNRPVAKARVVFSDFPERRETVSNADGAFIFPDVHNERPVTIFVDSRNSSVPPEFAGTHVFRSVDAKGTIFLQLPAGPAKVALQAGGGGGGCTTDEQYPSFAGYLTVLGQERWAPIDIRNVNPQNLQATVAVRAAGFWNFRYAINAFQIALGGAQFNTPGQPQTVQLFQPQGLPAVTLQFFNPNHSLAVRTDVYFPSFTEDPDPLDFQTDSNGVIVLNCVNVSPIYAWANVSAGFYDGNINLTGGYKAVTLCPHTSATCTE